MRVALAQMTSADRHAPNIATMREFARQAADEGAALLCLPEVAGLMNADFKSAVIQVVGAEADPYIAACRDAAARHGIWLHAGSTPVTGPGGKFRNHSALIAPDGSVAADYDKIHLFDVSIEGESPIGESKRFAPGARGVVIRTPLATFGLAICYDLRFPQLFRAYAQAGAQILFVPSAFTVPTGRAHWQVLLRARAIETGCFVIAAAQVGHHADGRDTWGHAMIVDPWGRVRLDLGGEEPGIGFAEIDLAEVETARHQIPSLKHDRPYSISQIETD